MNAPPSRLIDAVPLGRRADPDEVLERFVAWTAGRGLELYEAQEEALLELFSGQHVILKTPTGSGKSLVAVGMHFLALCSGARSFYTSPIKALVSEKFFELCEIFGAENVAMMTGDVSINRGAPITCATAEILANIAMCEGAHAPVEHVVMDEFHFFSEPSRGRAWQLPLLCMPQTQLLLMSATLGDTSAFEQKIPARSGRELTVVSSEERPVPLQYEYSERPMHEALRELLQQGRGPVYVVHFSQREASELAQDLVSLSVADRPQRDAIAREISGTRFDSVFGPELKRILRSGVGVHHAGMLPRYRRLVERLAQAGLLQVVCGTDTLGVGINVPIRTVLFSKLCKYDGQKTARLTVRDFMQIAGRAGRRGFDTRGWVVAQAPAHVIENKRLEEKAKASGKKKFQRKSPPERGYVPWDARAFEQLIAAPPETLTSRFSVDHGTILQFLQRPSDAEDGLRGGGYGALVRSVRDSYERPGLQTRLLRRAAELFRALRQSEVVVLERAARGGYRPSLTEGLDRDFSMFHTLSLWLVEASEQIDLSADDHELDVLTLCESLVEEPHVILRAQLKKVKADLYAELKAEGVDYETRQERLDAATHPRPLEEELYASFNEFRQRYPWAGEQTVRPKSIAREMYERRASFNEYVRELGIKRSEGILLRYLSEVQKILDRTLPERSKSDAVLDALGYLTVLVTSVDRSLLEEWSALVNGRPDQGAVVLEASASSERTPEQRRRSRRAVVRAQLHAIVAALHASDYDRAASLVRVDSEHPEGPWDAARWERALSTFVDSHGPPLWDPPARAAHHTRIDERDPERWVVEQTLTDPEGHDEWIIRGYVRADAEETAPMVEIDRVGV